MICLMGLLDSFVFHLLSTISVLIHSHNVRNNESCMHIKSLCLFIFYFIF